MKNKNSPLTKNKKILITGGAGYIGSKLVNTLISKGFGVVVIDNLSSGIRSNISREAVFYKLDINSTKILNVFKKEKPDIIIHLAASKDVNSSLENPVEFAKINILGSVNLINCARQLGIKKIIFTSTAGVYGDNIAGKKQRENQSPDPSSPYAWTKLAIEQYITYMNKYYGMKCIILRFANVYGPGGESYYKSAVNIFVNKFLKNQPVAVYGDGNQTRDFIYIDDLIDILKNLIEIDFAKINHTPIFNVSTGKEISIIELLKLTSKITKRKTKIYFQRDTFSGQKRSLLDPTYTKHILGWFAKTSLKQGVFKTLQSYNK